MRSSDAEEHESAVWALRLSEGELSPEHQEGLDLWLAERPMRRGTLLRAEATLALIDRGRALERQPVGRKGWWRRLPKRAAVAGIAVAGIAASTALIFVRVPEHVAMQTAIGEMRRAPLEDGSTLSLNTDSAVTVDFGANERIVRLERGEAWFQVAHDGARPFIVQAGQVRVRAVGTAFSVRRRSAQTDVLVTEGVVQVWTIGHEGRRVSLRAGYRSVIEPSLVVVAKSPPVGAIERQLAWRSGELALDGEPLTYAVAELNRYNRRKIVVDDPAVGREPLVGYFRTDRPQDFAQAVTVLIGAHVRVQGDEIHIAR
jgi:transmembrane sensor